MYRLDGGDGSELLTQATILQIRRRHDSAAKQRRAANAIFFDELGDLAYWASNRWPWLHVPESLARHIARDSSEADLILGDSPETWGPLGQLRGDSVGMFTSNDELDDRLVQAAKGNSAASVRIETVGEPLATGVPLLRMKIAADPIGIIAFASDAFVMPIPPFTDHVEISHSVVRSRGDAPPHTSVRRAMLLEVPDGEYSTSVLWRLYVGPNTECRDGLTTRRSGSRGHLLRVRTQDVAGVLVGRVVFGVHKILDRTPKDPTAAKRLRRYERQPKFAEVAKECPDIRSVKETVDTVIIAVHGTMSCAVPLASFISDNAPGDARILRFEHDTWLPVSANAAELAAEVARINARHVLLVAHSRGGLVSAEVLDRLRHGSAVEVARLLSLGTPYGGTPIADAARIGLLGFHAALGGLRVVGGPVVDASTRMAGLLLKRELPQGISDMRPSSSLILGTSWRPLDGAMSVGGSVTPLTLEAHHGLYGFASEAFQNTANDLVVSQESATQRGDATATVTCDHFSYPVNVDAARLLRELAHRFPTPGKRAPRAQEGQSDMLPW